MAELALKQASRKKRIGRRQRRLSEEKWLRGLVGCLVRWASRDGCVDDVKNVRVLAVTDACIGKKMSECRR